MFTIIISGEAINDDAVQKVLEDEFGAEYDEDTVAFIDADTDQAGVEDLKRRLTERLTPLCFPLPKIELEDDLEEGFFDDEEDEEYEDDYEDEDDFEDDEE